MIKNKTKKIKNKGFSLVETLVAITILLVTMTAPLYALTQAVLFASIARDKIIATSLAEEGIEYVRSIRDNNYLNGRFWLAGIDGTSNGRNQAACMRDGTAQSACVVDVKADTVGLCLIVACPLLKISTITKGYELTGAFPDSKFKRYFVYIDDLTNTQRKIIRMTVTWTERGKNYSVTLDNYLYNWQ